MVEQLRLEQAGTPAFLDTLYELLADSRRRDVLQFLLQHRKSVSVTRLAAELAAAEDGLNPAHVTVDRQNDVELLLTHAHLPLLADTGVIQWDRHAEQVTLTPLLERLSITAPMENGLLEVTLRTRPNTS
ncbi:hypothetical protein G6M89_00210 [Natronolimnobius sp. AArcel1]|uniref:DUF7344 domain-containing protein n=1 Tax=Natronolimnobius sp. AArcel1 TaxID=1679093 RepID=UPI0013EDF7BF|nr:hypothetical protein [Natronolimnobius sp. AArcel1]NGM67442.1 hypothetical protein [Natronolimnobius sp. AArcel1]